MSRQYELFLRMKVRARGKQSFVQFRQNWGKLIEVHKMLPVVF